MTTALKYTIDDFSNISSNGFNFIIPEETLNIINYLTSQVGSNNLIHNPLFQKKQLIDKDTNIFSSAHNILNKPVINKKRKGNKGMEATDEEWNNQSTSSSNDNFQTNIFHSTRLEQKTGIDTYIDQIRLYINKISEKTYNEMYEKICEQFYLIENEELIDAKDMNKVSQSIYDILSNNKFYSDSYAKLYYNLSNKFNWLRKTFEERYKNILNDYLNIKYVDPDINYDEFCNNNKINEKRKSHTMFIVNLAKYGYIKNIDNMRLLKELIHIVINMINEEGKKNEVDELTENIALLYPNNISELMSDDSDYEDDDFEINGKSIQEIIKNLSQSKSKDYKSLSNKAIFRYMDLIEI
jgi:hypothetical protein